MPSVILRSIRQRIKTQPISLQNRLSNQCPNFHRCLAQFPFILGGFWGPNWLQNPSQVDPKINQQTDRLLHRRKIDPCTILGPNLGGPGGVRGGSVRRLFRLLKLSWSQDGLKTLPRRPKTPPRGPWRPIFQRFWPPTCSLLQPT